MGNSLPIPSKLRYPHPSSKNMENYQPDCPKGLLGIGGEFVNGLQGNKHNPWTGLRSYKKGVVMFSLWILIGCNEVDPIDKDVNSGDSETKAESETGENAGPQPGDGEEGRMVGITDAHNLIRQEKGIPDLWWSQELVDISMEWLVHLEANNSCYMEHNWDSPYGENLYWSNYRSEAADVVNSWASEETFYDYDSNDCEPGEMCGHYTQIVWEDTTHVGCAVIECSNGSEMWMCNYDPAGNWVGERPY